MKYDWILFDADNTLFDFDKSERYALQTTLSQFGLTFTQENLDLYHAVNRRCWREMEEGKLSKEELRIRRFKLFFAGIKKEADPQAVSDVYLKTLSQCSFLIEGAIPLLEAVRGQYKLGLVTNGLKEVQRPRIKKAQIGEYFEILVVSDEIGHAKPHAPFFDFAFSQMQNPPKNRVIMVGDSIHSDIQGGNNYGLDTCWYNYENRSNHLHIKPTFEITQLSQLHEVLNP